MKWRITFLLGLIIASGCGVIKATSKEWKLKWTSEDVAYGDSLVKTFYSSKTVVKERPNVVLIVPDDLGKFELSCYGAKDIETPNIDALASQSLIFDNAYVSAPICAPSRAGILTGRYQQSYGFETQPMDFYPTNKIEYKIGKKQDLGDWELVSEPKYPRDWEWANQGVPPSVPMLSEVLKNNGYATGIVGKWHLGPGKKVDPIARGFDYQYGFYGAFSLYTPKKKTPGYVNYVQDDMSSRFQWNMERHESSAIKENRDVVKSEDYLTFDFTNKAKDFVSKNKDTNFFLYLAYNAPHVPFQAPQEYYDMFPEIKDSNRRVYLAMIKALDDAVGDFMAHCKKEGLLENTIFLFYSDNGAATYTKATVNDGVYKGGKLTYFEGGVNVPAFIYYPKQFNHERFGVPVSALDIVPTVLDACGLESTGYELDGVSWLDMQTNIRILDRPIYWRADHAKGIRYRNYKLIWSTRDNWMHLYDVEKDISEEFDLEKEYPKEVEKLKAFYRDWESGLPTKPLWPRIMDRKFIIDDTTYYFPA